MPRCAGRANHASSTTAGAIIFSANDPGRNLRLMPRATPSKTKCFRHSVPIPPECSLWELLQNGTGLELPSEHLVYWQERTEREQRQKLNTVRVLGQAPHDSSESKKDKIFIVGLMSGYTQRVVKTPRWNCFPWVARTHRRELMLNLAFFLHHTPGCHHLRVTQGQRVPLTRLRSKLRQISKLVSRLNSRPWFRQRLEIILRCCETTWDGGTAHIHAHLVVRPLAPMSAPEWIDVNARVRAHFGADVGTFEPIGEIDLAVPYLTKPCDFDGFNDDQIRTLARQTRHLRTHEPMGTFRDFCRMLTQTNTKLVRRRDRIVRVNRSDGSRRRQHNKRGAARRGQAVPAPVNQVVRIGQPRPHGTTRFEPALYVRGYTGDLGELLEKYPDLREMRDQLMPQWPRRPRHAQSVPPIVPSIVHLIDHIPSEQAATCSHCSANSNPVIAAAADLSLAAGNPKPLPLKANLSALPARSVPLPRQQIATRQPFPVDDDDNGDVTPAPRSRVSPFLRSEMDCDRQLLDDPPDRQSRRKSRPQAKWILPTCRHHPSPTTNHEEINV